MDRLFDILYYSASNILWGVLIGVTCLVLFFLVIKGWYKDAHFKPITYIIGAVLGCLLVFQSILICGSISIIRTAESYEPFLTECVQKFPPYTDTYISSEQSEDIVDALIDHAPLVSKYIGAGKFTGYKSEELPHAIILELKSYMRYYIMRRLLWCFAFVIIGAVVVIKTMERKSHARRATISDRYQRPVRRESGYIPRRRN